MRRATWTLFRRMGQAVLGCSFLYGEYYAVRTFFDIKVCTDWGNCRWILSGWHPVAIGVLFVFVYLPLSPLVSALGAWPGYAIGIVLLCIGQRRRRHG